MYWAGQLPTEIYNHSITLDAISYVAISKIIHKVEIIIVILHGKLEPGINCQTVPRVSASDLQMLLLFTTDLKSRSCSVKLY